MDSKHPLDKSVNVVYFFFMRKSNSEKVNEKRARKALEIQSTALDVVLDHGLEGLSMHEVARRLGVTVGALYRYFDSKQTLVASLEVHCLHTIQEALSSFLSASPLRSFDVIL